MTLYNPFSPLSKAKHLLKTHRTLYDQLISQLSPNTDTVSVLRNESINLKLSELRLANHHLRLAYVDSDAQWCIDSKLPSSPGVAVRANFYPIDFPSFWYTYPTPSPSLSPFLRSAFDTYNRSVVSSRLASLSTLLDVPITTPNALALHNFLSANPCHNYLYIDQSDIPPLVLLALAKYHRTDLFYY